MDKSSRLDPQGVHIMIFETASRRVEVGSQFGYGLGMKVLQQISAGVLVGIVMLHDFAMFCSSKFCDRRAWHNVQTKQTDERAVDS